MDRKQRDRNPRGPEVTWSGNHVYRKSRVPEVTWTGNHMDRKSHVPEVMWTRSHVDPKSCVQEIMWAGRRVDSKSRGPEKPEAIGTGVDRNLKSEPSVMGNCRDRK